MENVRYANLARDQLRRRRGILPTSL
jgi:hypothetical protein